MARKRSRRAHDRRPGTGRALLWTIGSTLVPGIAHLRMGRRAAGWTILGILVALIAAGIAAWVLLNGDISRGARIVAQGRWLATTAVVTFVIAVLWMTIVVHSWVILRPRPTRWPTRITGGALVVLLCLAIAAPAAAVLRTTYTAYDTLSSVFGPEAGDEPHDASDPWSGRDRVNVLLLGGDSGSNRYGMRTDSMMVASIDVEHGDVVLVGLPRNLQNAQFPKGSALAKDFPPPHGFDKLLNEVYQTVSEAPQKYATDPDAKDPAADTMKGVLGNLTGLDLDYYALVDMKGFEGLIDAIGGIDVHIDQPIPYGQEGKVLEKGNQHLNGNEALWYGRSRVQSDDYSRMGRQGCLLKYVAEQAEPTTVLTSFQDLAGATKKTLRTDIPQSKVASFIDLADLVTDDGDMKTLQLAPPQVDTAYPDWKEIRGLVADSVGEQEDRQAKEGEKSDDASDTDTPGSPSPSAPGEDGSGPDDQASQGGTPKESGDTPGRQVGDEADSLDKICPS